MSFVLETGDGVGFVLGEGFGYDVVDADLVGDVLGGTLIVAGDHVYGDVHCVEVGDGFLCFGADGVSDGD